MSWLNGVFTRVHDWTSDRDAGIAILSTRHDVEDNNLAAGINNCITKDGSNSPVVNLPMAGNRHTGCSDGVNDDEYATIGQVMSSDGSTVMTDDFDMGGNRVINAGNGINPSDLITKTQLDSALGGTGSVLTNGTTPLIANWALGSFKITGAADGVGNSDYSTVGQTFLRDGTAAMGNRIHMNNNKIISMADGQFSQDAVTFSQMNTAIAAGGSGGGGTVGAVLADGTVPLTANWAINSRKITGAADGSLGNDYTTVNQSFLKNGNNAMTGRIHMGLNQITSMAAGLLSGDAVNLGQMNTAIAAASGGGGSAGKVLQTVYKNITSESVNSISVATQIGTNGGEWALTLTPQSSTSKLFVKFSWMGESTVPLITGFKFGVKINNGVLQPYVPTGAGNNAWDAFHVLPDKQTGDMQSAYYEVVYESFHNAGVPIEFVFLCQSTDSNLILAIGNNRTIQSPDGNGIERGVSFIQVQEMEL